MDGVSRQSGWISPVLLVDGLIAGVWSHEAGGKAPQHEDPTVRAGAEARPHSGGA